jgi:hypothetical protein
MPDAKPTPDLALESDELKRDILYLITEPGDNQPLWSVEDIGRAMDQPLDAADAISELRRAGLVHRTSDGFVFATRAAVRHIQMVGRVI